MTRKRFIKLAMGCGTSRNRARKDARCVVIINKHAEKANRNAARRELEAILRYLDGNRTVNLDPIPRHRMLSYQEAWDRVNYII